jgi:hypothetical protein
VGRYEAPDPDDPSKGVLAAAAVRMLAPYIANAVYQTPWVEKAGRIRIRLNAARR